MKNIILLIMLFIAATLAAPARAELSCNVTNVGADGDCPSGSTQVIRMNDADNAHARMPGLPPATYDYAVCCQELYGGTLGISCPGDTGKRVGLANLSAASNAHAEKVGQNNYGGNNDICLSSTANVTMGYNDTGSCDSFDTCLFSMSADTNAHVGNCTAYARRVCASTHNITLTVTQGNGSTVETDSYNPVNLTITFFDVPSGTYASGRSGAIFVEKSPGILDNGHACTTNSNGNCSVSFVPDCTYSGGSAKFRGGPFGDSLYKDKNSTNGTVIIDVSGRCANTVTFEMEINISGGGTDSYEVDGKGAGFYRPSDLTNYYACTQDAALTNTPTFGIVFAGDQLNYINLTAGNESVMKLSQFRPGNKFILPVTRDGCSAVRDKVPSIKGGVLPQPFVQFLDLLKSPITIMLSYPELDILGDFTKTGTFTLLMEKNVSGSTTQIIFRG